MNAAPKPRRRIAGEVKPADVAPSTPRSERKSRLPKPSLPNRPNPEPARTTTSELPAAPPRLESSRAPRRTPSAMLIALIGLAIASVGFGAFGVWHGIDEWRNTNIVDAHADATDAAASAAEEIFSYKYNALDEHMRQSQKAMTPKFAKKFRSISPALNALAPQRKIQVKAVVRHAAATECGDTCSPVKARVLIFVDQARITGESDEPAVFGNRIEVFMVERDGRWLVDDIKAL